MRSALWHVRQPFELIGPSVYSESCEQLVKQGHGRSAVAEHGPLTCDPIGAHRPGPQAQEWRQAVATRNAVHPESRCAPIAVRERVDAHPLCMGPGAHLDDCRELVSVELSVTRDPLVETTDDLLEDLFEMGKLVSHLGCRHA